MLHVVSSQFRLVSYDCDGPSLACSMSIYARISHCVGSDWPTQTTNTLHITDSLKFIPDNGRWTHTNTCSPARVQHEYNDIRLHNTINGKYIKFPLTKLKLVWKSTGHFPSLHGYRFSLIGNLGDSAVRFLHTFDCSLVVIGTDSSGGFGGVRGVQMHPPLAASFCVNNCTSHQMIIQQWNAATTTSHSYTLTYQFLTDLQTFD